MAKIYEPGLVRWLDWMALDAGSVGSGTLDFLYTLSKWPQIPQLWQLAFKAGQSFQTIVFPERWECSPQSLQGMDDFVLFTVVENLLVCFSF